MKALMAETATVNGQFPPRTYRDSDSTLRVGLTLDAGRANKAQYIGFNQREDSVACPLPDTERSARTKAPKVFLSDDGSTWGRAVKSAQLPSRRGIRGIHVTAANTRCARPEVDSTCAARPASPAVSGCASTSSGSARRRPCRDTADPDAAPHNP